MFWSEKRNQVEVGRNFDLFMQNNAFFGDFYKILGSSAEMRFQN